MLDSIRGKMKKSTQEPIILVNGFVMHTMIRQNQVNRQFCLFHRTKEQRKYYLEQKWNATVQNNVKKALNRRGSVRSILSLHASSHFVLPTLHSKHS